MDGKQILVKHGGTIVRVHSTRLTKSPPALLDGSGTGTGEAEGDAESLDEPLECEPDSNVGDDAAEGRASEVQGECSKVNSIGTVGTEPSAHLEGVFDGVEEPLLGGDVPVEAKVNGQPGDTGSQSGTVLKRKRRGSWDCFGQSHQNDGNLEER